MRIENIILLVVMAIMLYIVINHLIEADSYYKETPFYMDVYRE